jgi:hypothetical protein
MAAVTKDSLAELALADRPRIRVAESVSFAASLRPSRASAFTPSRLGGPDRPIQAKAEAD